METGMHLNMMAWSCPQISGQMNCLTLCFGHFFLQRTNSIMLEQCFCWNLFVLEQHIVEQGHAWAIKIDHLQICKEASPTAMNRAIKRVILLDYCFDKPFKLKPTKPSRVGWSYPWEDEELDWVCTGTTAGGRFVFLEPSLLAVLWVSAVVARYHQYSQSP